MNRSEHAKELAKLHPDIKLGSEIEPGRARCSGKCLKLIPVGELHEGLCLDCFENAKEEKSQNAIRAAVLLRDAGVCSECGVDCLDLRATADAFKATGGHLWKAHLHLLAMRGFDKHAVESGHALWEAAHVKSRVSGGADDVRNVVTLCLAHHKSDSKALANGRSKWPKGRRIGR